MPCTRMVEVALSSRSPVKISGTRSWLPDAEGLLQMFCLARPSSLSEKPPRVGPCQAGSTQPAISGSPKCHRRAPLLAFLCEFFWGVFFLSLVTFFLSFFLKKKSVAAVEGSLLLRITPA